MVSLIGTHTSPRVNVLVINQGSTCRLYNAKAWSIQGRVYIRYIRPLSIKADTGALE